MEELKTKVCSKCHEEKDVSEFSKDKYSKDGLAYYCKSCLKELRKNVKHIEVKTKVCSKCHKEKEINEFTKSKNKKDGHNCYCKDCMKEINNSIKHIEIKEKKCNKCNEIKSISEFYNNKNNKDNHSSICRECSIKYAELYRINNPEKIKSNNNRDYHEKYMKRKAKCSKDYFKEVGIRTRKKNYLKHLIRGCVKRAKDNNLLYDSVDELFNYLKPIYDLAECECCHCKLENGVGKGSKHAQSNSPSIDRIIPEKGYVIDNVAILCWRCNAVKNNGTWQEHLMIANWIKEKNENNLQSPNLKVVIK